LRVEDYKSVGSDPLKDARPNSGRKPVQESRSTEFRQTLIAWRQIPAAARLSLRALARQLGTSHQLLKHYLDELEKWQFKERYRKATEESDQILARAIVEDRPMTQWEQQRRHDCTMAAVRATAITAMLGTLECLKREAKRCPLHPTQIKMLRVLAGHFLGAQELLQKYSQRCEAWLPRV
jgi:hypothetical protein